MRAYVRGRVGVSVSVRVGARVGVGVRVWVRVRVKLGVLRLEASRACCARLRLAYPERDASAPG